MLMKKNIYIKTAFEKYVFDTQALVDGFAFHCATCTSASQFPDLRKWLLHRIADVTSRHGV